MNVLEEVIIKSPNNIDEKCGKFTIDDVTDPFILSSITRSGEHYMFSAWIKSSVAGTVSIYGEKINTTTEWSKYEIGFSSNGTGVNILFEVSATYYFYHSKLEIGNKATDWTPAPEDMVDKENIISCINQTPEEITIQASKISLEGLITANGGFKVLEDGSVETINGKFSGAINIYNNNDLIGKWDSDGFVMNKYFKAGSETTLDSFFEIDSSENISKVYIGKKRVGYCNEYGVYIDPDDERYVENDGRFQFFTEYDKDYGRTVNGLMFGNSFWICSKVDSDYPYKFIIDDLQAKQAYIDDLYVNGYKVTHVGQFKTSTQTITTDKYGQASLTQPSDFAYALGMHSEHYEYGILWVNGLNIRAYNIASSKTPTRADNVSFKVSLNYVTK